MLATADVLELVTRSHDVEAGQRRSWLQTEMAKLAMSADEVVSVAVPAIESTDRNVRVKALRLLALFPDPRATAAVLRGLQDPVPRVREVAIDSVRPHHIGSPDVVAALRAMAEDDSERDRLRRYAYSAISNSVARDELHHELLTFLTESDRFRLPVLVRLCKTPVLTAEARALLQEFVRSGTKDEAVMATRALCGFMAVGINGWLPPDERQRVVDTYDAAPEVRSPWGFSDTDTCWIPTKDALELVRKAGYSTVP